MFAADVFGDLLGVHPLEGFESLALAAEADAVHETRGLFVAERAGQHIAYEVVAADADRGLAFERVA